MRTNIDNVWQDWFDEALAMAEDVRVTIVIPRVTKVQRNRTNVQAEKPR